MHVNDRVAQPEAEDAAQQPAGARGARAAAWLGQLIRAHRPFVIVLAVAVALRVVVMLGYPPAMFFNDSYNYMTDAVTKTPDIVRSNGYPFFLYALLPFHSLALVTGLQAVMGLAMGTGIYAVLRHRGLPWWGATIPALPVLFDVFELQLEHMIAADVLFYTLITAALVLLCWWDRPPMAVAVLAGLAIGYAATVRTVGEPLLVIVLICMLARRMGWRRIAATAVAGVVPIAGYMFWFHIHTGQYALDESTGTFLYSRVSSFSNCAVMRPPADLRVLCDPRPPSRRPNSQEYLWSNHTPLAYLTGTKNNIYRFTPQIESLTTRFAERAILAQPLDYARVVAKDTLTNFGWARLNETNDIGNLTGSGSKFRFESDGHAGSRLGDRQQHQRRGRAGLRRRELRAAVGGPAVELVPAALPAGRVPARDVPAAVRGGRRRRRGARHPPQDARARHRLGRPRPAALADRGSAARAAVDDRGLQLPLRPGRGSRGLPCGGTCIHQSRKFHNLAA